MDIASVMALLMTGVVVCMVILGLIFTEVGFRRNARKIRYQQVQRNIRRLEMELCLGEPWTVETEIDGRGSTLFYELR